ncbi:MAG: LysR family transcriptional regulator, partial [Candidatus Eremiobacteraeota bacterium]|nr:LysR family transcriptional regulator [Candidatus Eremiobacteraeota bacterium]
MELRHLRYFVAVAEELNFTRAAEREMVAQSSLSQQIQDLEQELGLQLFARSTRKTELTSVGQDLLAEARAILKRVERFEQRARRRSRGQLGRLRLSAISALANAELAELLRGFRGQHPDIEVGLDVHPSLWQVAALREGTIDAGFVTLPDSLLAGLA